MRSINSVLIYAESFRIFPEPRPIRQFALCLFSCFLRGENAKKLHAIAVVHRLRETFMMQHEYRAHHLLKYMLRSPYTCRKNGSFRSLMK